MTGLADKTVLVTGGCGFIGSALVREIVAERPAEVRVFDNDQQRLFELQRELDEPAVTVRYVLGDLRDESRVALAMDGVDVVFHAGAVKHVELSEYNPTEAVRTNVLGTRNVLRAAVDGSVESFTAVSTDKASNPSCVMGATKFIMERAVVAANGRCDREATFNCVRFGNVLGSTGSVVPIFLDQIRNGGPLTVTDPDMTRFVMPVERAVELVLEARDRGSRGRVFVLKMPACRVGDLADGLRSAYAPDYGFSPGDIDVEYVGRRPGERAHERLVSREELDRAEELEDMFVLQPDIDVGDGSAAGTASNTLDGEYTSANVPLLAPEEIVAMVDRSDAVRTGTRVEA